MTRGKSRVLVLERNMPTNCKIRLNGMEMERVFGSMMRKDDSLENEVRQRVKQYRKLSGALQAVVCNRNISA